MTERTPTSQARKLPDEHPGPAAPDAPSRPSAITADDIFLFNEGTHYRLHDKLGAHPAEIDGKRGVSFAVWAPNARYVSVIGDFNGWDAGANPLTPHDTSGIWHTLVEGIGQGERYQFHISSGAHQGYWVNKADPFGFEHEVPPRRASIVRALDYDWHDDDWMASRADRVAHGAPMSIYEVHLGSWMHAPNPESEGAPSRPLTYRELAPRLVEHVTRLGFTHVEFLPVMEHPLYRSWGYQTTGYFAPTSRFGLPQDFMFLIDQLHQAGIGVILDWVPSHFPSDEHGLGYFDGTHLFEHADPRQGFHPDWKSLIFNYGRNEVRAFLISSAAFWLEKYHIDGLRVDAVASMLYLDYSRREGEWIPNQYGGRENIEAIDFLRQLNTELYGSFPDTCTIAEESTAWPSVSRPTYTGGLGFGYKWDMGWMHDTLTYLQKDPVHRRHHHNQLTFRAMYQFSENYVLPLSHDEVVHGKGSLLAKMAGDPWQRFANLRLLLANQWTQPGKKLLFMGGELGQWREWDFESSLDWRLLQQPQHEGLTRLVADLNRLYRELPPLHELDCDPAGFRWIDAADSDQSVVSFLRLGRDGADAAIVVMNCTPLTREHYVIGAPRGGTWLERLNTDATAYGGSGAGNLGRVEANPIPKHGLDWSLTLTLPPLAILVLAPADSPHQDGKR